MVDMMTQECGIDSQYTMPGTPQQNGIEREEIAHFLI